MLFFNTVEDLLAYNNQLTIRIIPNQSYKFKIKIKYKGFNWTETETNPVSSKNMILFLA